MRNDQKAIMNTIEECKVMDLDVSIVIPSYNQKPRYLYEAIESALNQSYPREKYEILVVDDGSTRILPDQVVQQFKRNRVILVKKRHGGIADTLNAGIRSMKGKYFKWLSSDDALYEDALKLLMSKANENTVVYGDWASIDQNSNFIEVIHERTFSDIREMRQYLWHYYFGMASGVLIPRSAFAKVGMFENHLPFYEDYDWWLRAVFLHGYAFVHVDGIVAKYRIHVGQLSQHGWGKRPLITWHIKKRLYSAHSTSSALNEVSSPSFAALINEMLFFGAKQLYRSVFRRNLAPTPLRKIRDTLMLPL